LSFLIGERASKIGRRGEVAEALSEEKSLGEGGAFVRKKLVGFTNEDVSFEDPSATFERLGERKIAGSMFSESLAESKSKDSALRFEGEVRVEVMAV
jgi:hypothetical protein